jgi:hypothetical protein
LGELDVIESPVPERVNGLVEAAQIRDTSDREIPDPIPNASTGSSTSRVYTPATYASITTAYNA